MHGLIVTFLFVVAGILVYRYHRNILAVVKRFDDRNRARIEREAPRQRATSLPISVTR